MLTKKRAGYRASRLHLRARSTGTTVWVGPHGDNQGRSAAAPANVGLMRRRLSAAQRRYPKGACARLGRLLARPQYARRQLISRDLVAFLAKLATPRRSWILEELPLSWPTPVEGCADFADRPQRVGSERPKGFSHLLDAGACNWRSKNRTIIAIAVVNDLQSCAFSGGVLGQGPHGLSVTVHACDHHCC
jgi:hypothetical protein